MKKVEELIKKIFQSKVKYRTIQEICSITRGRVMSKEYIKNNEGKYSVYSSQTENDGELGKISTYDLDGEYLTWTTDGANAGSVFYRNGKFSVTNVCGLLKVISNEITTKFLHYILSKETKKYVNSGMGNPKLMSNVMAKIHIPVPPIEVQNEIVRILDNFTELEAELEARKEQYNYYFYKLMNSNQYRKIKLSEIGKVKMCKRILKNQTTPEGDIPFYKIGTFGKKADAYISEETFKELKSKYSYPKKGDILISCSGTIGRTVVFDGKPAYFQDSNIVWLEHDETIITNSFLKYCYRMSPWRIATGGTIARLYNDNILNAEVLVPTLDEQERIVSILDRFDKICNDITEGIPAEIEARRKQYEYYRDKLLDFKELKVENKE